MNKLVVREIHDQGDRVVLRGDDAAYKIIATLDQARGVEIGDTISYEPYGWNFGWFKAAQDETTKRGGNS